MDGKDYSQIAKIEETVNKLIFKTENESTKSKQEMLNSWHVQQLYISRDDKENVSNCNVWIHAE